MVSGSFIPGREEVIRSGNKHQRRERGEWLTTQSYGTVNRQEV